MKTNTDVIMEIIDYMEENLTENLNLDKIAYIANYSKTSTYGEEYGEYIVENVNYGTPSYEMTTENKIDGSGVDFKFGAIVRPFEDSPFRIGVAVHTPTFYNLKILKCPLYEVEDGKKTENHGK